MTDKLRIGNEIFFCGSLIRFAHLNSYTDMTRGSSKFIICHLLKLVETFITEPLFLHQSFVLWAYVATSSGRSSLLPLCFVIHVSPLLCLPLSSLRPFLISLSDRSQRTKWMDHCSRGHPYIISVSFSTFGLSNIFIWHLLRHFGYFFGVPSLRET